MANALIKKTGIYFVGNLAAKMTTALIIPIYAYFVEVSALGEYDYLISLMQMAAPLMYCAVWEAILRFVLKEKDLKEKWIGASNAIVISFISIILIIFSAAIFTSVGVLSLLQSSTAAILSIFYGLVQMWQYFARSFGESKIYALSGVIGAIVNFVLVIVLVCALQMQLIGLVLSYAVGQITIIGFLEIKLKLIAKFKFEFIDRNIIARFIKFSFPLAINLLLLTYVMTFGRILITNTLGAESNGIYTFAMKFGSVITTVGSIFAMAVVEEAIIRIDKPGADSFFQEVVSNAETLLLSISLLALPIVKLFYYVIDKTEYSSSYSLVPIFFFYAIFTVMSTIVGCIFQTKKRTNLVALTSFIGAIFTTLLSLILIQMWGENGVAIALSFGALSMLIARHIFGVKLVRYRFLTFKNFLMVCLLLFVSIVSVVFIEAEALAIQVLWLVLSVVFIAPMALRAYSKLRNIPDAE